MNSGRTLRNPLCASEHTISISRRSGSLVVWLFQWKYSTSSLSGESLGRVLSDLNVQGNPSLLICFPFLFFLFSLLLYHASFPILVLPFLSACLDSLCFDFLLTFPCLSSLCLKGANTGDLVKTLQEGKSRKLAD